MLSNHHKIFKTNIRVIQYQVLMMERVVKLQGVQDRPAIQSFKENVRPVAPGRQPARKGNLTNRCHAIGLMKRHQYDAKSKTLEELYGVQLKDFGRRRLEQGTSGHDVVALQQFLLEEGYLARDDEDGIHGYFGDSTKRALQSWQTDVGIPATGVLDDVSRAEYLNFVENTWQETIRMVENIDTTSEGRLTEPHVSVAFGIAIAGILTMILRVYFVFGGRSQSANERPPSLSGHVEKSSDKKKLPLRNGLRRGTMRKSGVGQGRLSKEELERHIAPMKNGQLAKKHSTSKTKGESKLGRYFGGRQVLEEIRKEMKYDEKKTARVMPMRFSETMEHVGYNMTNAEMVPHREHDTILYGTELDTRSPVKEAMQHPTENATDDRETQHKVLDGNTMVVQNRPVKLHKPSRLLVD